MNVAQQAQRRKDGRQQTGDVNSLRNTIASALSDATHAFSHDLSIASVSKEVLRGSVLLAHLDRFARTKVLHDGFCVVNDTDLEELRALYDIVPWHLFRAAGVCALNPTFGEGSRLVGGADADLLMDDILIDIKTTKRDYVDLGYVHQLVGYLVLMRIGGMDGLSPDPVIERLGIYSARFGELWSMPLGVVISSENLDLLACWLQSHLLGQTTPPQA
jgi:hypothetical protein